MIMSLEEAHAYAVRGMHTPDHIPSLSHEPGPSLSQEVGHQTQNARPFFAMSLLCEHDTMQQATQNNTALFLHFVLAIDVPVHHF